MAERLTVTLHELVAAMDAYADAYLQRHHGVSFNLFEFLAALVEESPVDITGLARCLRVSKAAVSKRVPSLVAGGWLITAHGPGRRVDLTPTAAAIELVRNAGGELEGEFAAVFAEDAGGAAGTSVTIAALNERLSGLTRILEQKELP